jgi:hypothetical protein
MRCNCRGFWNIFEGRKKKPPLANRPATRLEQIFSIGMLDDAEDASGWGLAEINAPDSRFTKKAKK